jgi:hypothetical protein
MLTRELLRAEMKRSEEYEGQTYKKLTLSLFRGLQEPSRKLYDAMANATAQLTKLTPDAIRKSPAIIKILRYCLAPVVSQMRLGQIIEIGSTEPFEEQGVSPTEPQAQKLIEWFTTYLDRERFPWLDDSGMKKLEREIAERYAKLCTVSLLSNQNTATEYRTKRKERQEETIVNALKGIGLQIQDQLGPPSVPRARRRPSDPPHPPKPKKLGGVNAVDDIRPGHFVKEKKILGKAQKKQKSDVIARPKAAPVLFCVEAKAVGIRIDSTKRLKEVNDKYTDWQASGIPITTVAVVAGFFNDIELIATIQKRGIPIFFEHDLKQLETFLQSGVYYDSPWNPSTLFPDVSGAEVRAALEKIESATPGTNGGNGTGESVKP